MRPLLETLRSLAAGHSDPVADDVERHIYFCAFEHDCFVMNADDAAMNATQRATLSQQTARLVDNLGDLSLFSRLRRPPLEVLRLNYRHFAPQSNPVPRITFGIAGDNAAAYNEIADIVSEIVLLTFNENTPTPPAPALTSPTSDAVSMSATHSFSVIFIIFILMAFLGCRRRPARPATLLPTRDHWE